MNLIKTTFENIEEIQIAINNMFNVESHRFSYFDDSEIEAASNAMMNKIVEWIADVEPKCSEHTKFSFRFDGYRGNPNAAFFIDITIFIESSGVNTIIFTFRPTN